MTLFDDTSPFEYDAIVVGSGISGGWAAKELCEAGLKTLVLERGRHVEHGDYPTASLDPWDYDDSSPVWKLGDGYVSALREGLTQEELSQYGVLTRVGWAHGRSSIHHFCNDEEHPYLEAPGNRFDWIRGYQTGGRSLTWGRQSYRWSARDFEANKRDGHGVDWPIRYKDLAPYYSKVEEYIGVSGMKEGLDILPDGEFLPPMDFTAPEQYFRESVAQNYETRHVTIGRAAHLTNENGRPDQGRQACQYRNRCARGCPYGGYFSSNASTLPAADKTGNLTLRPFSIVSEVLYDPDTKRATGVRIVDKESKQDYEFKARLLFLNASAAPSAAIMLNSKSDRFPNGLGNDSDQLGRNIMDHHYQLGATASVEGFEDSYYTGRRANGFYIPRFRNIGGDTDAKDFLRGYGYQGGASRGDWSRGVAEMTYGKDLKAELQTPGPWQIGVSGFGEVLPHPENRLELAYEEPDAWGIPKIRFHGKMRENELAMREDIKIQIMEMFDKAGFKNITPYDREYGLGRGIHEMGTARMGRDPKTSVLDAHNRVHAVPNVYVTDGACMTSASCVNPSLTYMALTLRATEHAVGELKRMNI